jgi:uncharacterized membrane protein YfcA
MDLSLMALAAAFFAVAFLYSSVGHAGASGYIAVMALAGMAPATIKPLALLLNVLVASIGAYQFWRAGHFRWGLFWPFAVTAVPMAFAGGLLDLPARVFKVLVGVVLLLSAARFLARPGDPGEVSPPPRPVALGAGAGLGLLAGLTGTGGGIFLTPLLLLSKWARTKNVAAVSALFILVNSLAGLAGFASSGRELPAFAAVFGLAVVSGGALGSWMGSRRFPARTIQILLAGVLFIAGLKLAFGG